MGFYEELSRYYDEIFPVDAEDMRFLVQRMRGCARLLDLGCGTGNKTVFFSGPGVSVTGIDSDSGMIARATAENSRAGLCYEVLDMTAIDSRFAPGSFDGALCLGNTLVHLDGAAAIAAFIAKVAAALAPGGHFLLQILNYDRILENRQSVLPVLESANVIFRREYQWRDDGMRFVTSLEVKRSGEIFHNDIPLYPLRREELDNCLKNADFDAIRYYGGFGGEDHIGSSFVTIAEAVKSTAKDGDGVAGNPS